VRVNMLTQLCAHRAMMKSSRTMREPSPMYFCTSSEPDTRMNVQSVWCATARASNVLPVPGGPYSSTPCGITTHATVVRQKPHSHRAG
jgi:hypothetical protein